MNFLRNENGFIGSDKGESFAEFKRVYAIIKQSLGKHSGMLSNYISQVSKVLFEYDSVSLIERGCNIYHELRKVFLELLKGGVPSHPFGQIAADYIKEYPLYSVRENSLKAEIYSILLADTYFASTLPITEVLLSYDYTHIAALRDKIAAISGNELMEKFDAAMVSAWYPVSPLQCLKSGYFSMAHETLAASEVESFIDDILSEQPIC